ncbi:hypothetical protein E8E12_010863 [Didymella heteroderae]|uniref:F-box domain-containing protein n=1 Tax=Didymella heteroderae TaxID=1769908 RepID=A0A9P4X0N6_9PLEO|nr:hypothetical protein E8E12_010863 [Didymella heteroderae]
MLAVGLKIDKGRTSQAAQPAAVVSIRKQGDKDVVAALKSPPVYLLSMFYFFMLGTGITASGWVVEYLIEARNGKLPKAGYIFAALAGGIFLGRIVLAQSTYRYGERRMTLAHPSGRKTRQSTFTKSLDDLPEELMVITLDAIVNSLNISRPDEYYKALHSLCLTSRRYHRLAKPYLYACVDNRCFDPATILRAYSNQPDMRGSAKRIIWVDDASFHDFLSKTKLRYELRHPERRELCKAIGTMGLQHLEERVVSHAIKYQSSDDLLTLFLILNPDVEILEVADANIRIRPHGYWNTSPLWTRMMRLAALGSLERMQHFRHLHRLIIRMGPISLQSVVLFLNLPALHEFVLANAFHAGPLWMSVALQSKSTVQRLSIEGSLIDTDAISECVNAIKCLTEFRFEFCDADNAFDEQIMDDGYPEFSYKALSTALAPHKRTLQTLRIVNLENHRYLDDGSDDTLGSLRDMTNVREIKVSLRGFRAESEERLQDHANLHDNLPPNINYLRVYVEKCTIEDDPYESQWWKVSLRNLAQDCRASYPHLKTIVVSDKPIGVLPIDEDVRKLRAQFKEQGVSFSIKGEHRVTPIPAVQEWKKLTADRDVILNGMSWKSKLHAIHLYDDYENECLLRNWRGL